MRIAIVTYCFVLVVFLVGFMLHAELLETGRPALKSSTSITEVSETSHVPSNDRTR
jgi:hypothetical protein